jgi:hypothetical protein
MALSLDALRHLPGGAAHPDAGPKRRLASEREPPGAASRDCRANRTRLVPL